MAQLLCISDKTYISGSNNVGDIVSIKDDKHIFSPAEIGGFDIIKIDAVAVDKIEDDLNKLLPIGLLTNKEAYTKPKYAFKVINKTEITVDKICSTNVALK